MDQIEKPCRTDRLDVPDAALHHECDAGKRAESAPEKETFDDLLELAGGGGRFQLLLVAATSLGALVAAIDTFSVVFKIDSPDHWCVRDAANNSLSCVPTEAGCAAEACSVAGSDAACVQWQFDRSVYTSTVVSDFELVCGRAVLRSMMFTVQMLAGLVAALLFGLLGDWYGRARAAAVAVVLFAMSAPVMAAAPNLWMLFISASVTAGTHCGIYICLFTLCMESIGERHRSTAGLVWVLPWAGGIMLTAAAGWLLRSWWQLQLVCAAAGLLLLPGVWLLPESPRWLAAHGRAEEAAAGLRRMAAVNGRLLPADITERLRRLALAAPAEGGDGGGRCREALLLFSSRRMCCLSLATVWLWMVMAVVYYGIAFDSAQLADNAYLAMLLAGLVEVPSMAAVPLIDRCGRRPVMAATYLLTAAAILPVPAVPSGWPVLLLGMLGKLAIGAGFAIIYVHLEEYMPTEVRNAALGLSTMAESVGGAVSPHVAYGLGGWHWAAPSVVFGVLAVSAGLVALLVLPETAGRPLPEAVRDVQRR